MTGSRPQRYSMGSCEIRSVYQTVVFCYVPKCLKTTEPQVPQNHFGANVFLTVNVLYFIFPFSFNLAVNSSGAASQRWLGCQFFLFLILLYPCKSWSTSFGRPELSEHSLSHAWQTGGLSITGRHPEKAYSSEPQCQCRRLPTPVLGVQ